MHRDGDRLVIEPVRKRGLVALLKTMKLPFRACSIRRKKARGTFATVFEPVLVSLEVEADELLHRRDEPLAQFRTSRSTSQRRLCSRCPMWECGCHPRGEDMDKFKPDGWRTVTPRVFTDDVAGLVGFLKTVFGAGGELQSGAPTEMTIGDSVVMISDGGGAREAMPAFLYVYVENAEETYERAIAAGAESIERPADMPYGDRRDSWSNIWQIATYRAR